MPVENSVLARETCAHGKAHPRAVTVAIPIDTIANARTALERVVIVAAGVLRTIDAGVAEYGESETLRGIAQLFTALSRSVTKIFYFLLLVPVLHSHAWFGNAGVLHSLPGLL